MNWQTVFAPSIPILEIFVRGTVTYLALFLLLRLILKRQAGTVGITDLLVVVLLADAIQNGMSGGYTSVSDGIVLVTTILFWSYALDWLGYRFPRLQRLVHPPPLLLIKDGKMIRHNLRQELLTHEELMALLRHEGVEDISQVRAAFMEGDGRLSVITEEQKRQPRVND